MLIDFSIINFLVLVSLEADPRVRIWVHIIYLDGGGNPEKGRRSETGRKGNHSRSVIKPWPRWAIQEPNPVSEKACAASETFPQTRRDLWLHRWREQASDSDLESNFDCFNLWQKDVSHWYWFPLAFSNPPPIKSKHPKVWGTDCSSFLLSLGNMITARGQMQLTAKRQISVNQTEGEGWLQN